MRRFVLSLLGATALVSTAGAADLPSRAPAVAFAPAPAFTWTGFYAGINAGYAWSESGNGGTFTNPFAAGTLTTFATNSDGFTGGGQIGYNWQFGEGNGFVVGVEADIQYADLGRRGAGFGASSAAGLAAATAAGFTPVNNGVDIDWFGTVRGRIGYGFDRVLVYGTGGFAYGDGGNNSPVDGMRTGWVAGGGIEYALATDSFLNFFRGSGVTLKVEGLYVNLDRNSPNVFGFTPAATFAAAGGRVDDDFAVVRAGLNYKF